MRDESRVVYVAIAPLLMPFWRILSCAAVAFVLSTMRFNFALADAIVANMTGGRERVVFSSNLKIA